MSFKSLLLLRICALFRKLTANPILLAFSSNSAPSPLLRWFAGIRSAHSSTCCCGKRLWTFRCRRLFRRLRLFGAGLDVVCWCAFSFSGELKCNCKLGGLGAIVSMGGCRRRNGGCNCCCFCDFWDCIGCCCCCFEFRVETTTFSLPPPASRSLYHIELPLPSRYNSSLLRYNCSANGQSTFVHQSHTRYAWLNTVPLGHKNE